jgi:hypothetical protein
VIKIRAAEAAKSWTHMKHPPHGHRVRRSRETYAR